MLFSHDPDTQPLSCLILIGDFYYCIRLKNQTSFSIQAEFEESAESEESPPPKHSQHIHPAAGPQQQTIDKRLPGMLTYKVGYPCRLHFSWLHE